MHVFTYKIHILIIHIFYYICFQSLISKRCLMVRNPTIWLLKFKYWTTDLDLLRLMCLYYLYQLQIMFPHCQLQCHWTYSIVDFLTWIQKGYRKLVFSSSSLFFYRGIKMPHYIHCVERLQRQGQFVNNAPHCRHCSSCWKKNLNQAIYPMFLSLQHYKNRHFLSARRVETHFKSAMRRRHRGHPQVPCWINGM